MVQLMKLLKSTMGRSEKEMINHHLHRNRSYINYIMLQVNVLINFVSVKRGCSLQGTKIMTIILLLLNYYITCSVLTSNSFMESSSNFPWLEPIVPSYYMHNNMILNMHMHLCFGTGGPWGPPVSYPISKLYVRMICHAVNGPPKIVVPPDCPLRHIWSPQDKPTLPYRPWSLTLPYKPLRLTHIILNNIISKTQPLTLHAGGPCTVAMDSPGGPLKVWQIWPVTAYAYRYHAV